MEEKPSEVDVYGLKVFFINPSYSVSRSIVLELRKKEYEVYVIENYRDTKNILRRNQNSIIFINIDAHISVGAWFNFVRSFEKAEALSKVHVAVISEKIKPTDAEIFRKNLEGPEFYFDFNEGIDNIKEQVLLLLDKLNAKGKRQYVRATLRNDNEAALFWDHGSRMHKLRLIDISSVGMAAIIPSVLNDQIIAKNYLLHNVTMRLRSRQLTIEAVIFAVRQSPAGTVWVLLLMPNTPTLVKDEIRDYVSKVLEESLMASINDDPKDDMDYSQLAYYNLATRKKIKTSTSPFSTQPGYNN
jgi:hypothetical protein